MWFLTAADITGKASLSSPTYWQKVISKQVSKSHFNGDIISKVRPEISPSFSTTDCVGQTGGGRTGREPSSLEVGKGETFFPQIGPPFPLAFPPQFFWTLASLEGRAYPNPWWHPGGVSLSRAPCLGHGGREALSWRALAPPSDGRLRCRLSMLKLRQCPEPETNKT